MDRENDTIQVKKVVKLKKKYAIISLILAGIGLFSLILGASFAFFTATVQSSDVLVYTGSLQVDYTKTGNVINLTNEYPKTNAQGLSTTGYTFDITNTGTINVKYLIRLELDPTNTLPLEYVKLSYTKTRDNNNATDTPASDPVLVSNLNATQTIITDQVLDASKVDSYNLRLWIDYSAPNEIQGKTFKAKIVVDAMQNVEGGYAIANTPPIITLNKNGDGEIDYHLKVNDSFTDPGVESVRDDKDKLTQANVTVSYQYTNDGNTLTTVSGVDTTTVGVYYINYQVTDSNSLTAIATRVVTVNNTAAIPTITLNGSNPMSVDQGSTFTDPGATVATGNHVATIGEVKTSAPGTYIVRYIVIDTNGNINSVTRSVVVNAGKLLAARILEDNTLETTIPHFSTTHNGTYIAYGNNLSSSSATTVSINENGLYSMTTSNGFGGTGNTTYYFRGNVNNNYVDFAGFTWRIIRINEDGTIRLILDDVMDNNSYRLSTDTKDVIDMYYSSPATTVTGETTNQYAIYALDNWFNTNITDINRLKVATGNYFCESAKVKPMDTSHTYTDQKTGRSYTISTTYTSGNASMTLYKNYVPDLECPTDGNGKGLVNGSIGLINYDELVMAGAYPNMSNTAFYLYNSLVWWTMSPAGMSNDTTAGLNGNAWVIGNGNIHGSIDADAWRLRPVINLKADTIASYNATTGHYEVY